VYTRLAKSKRALPVILGVVTLADVAVLFAWDAFPLRFAARSHDFLAAFSLALIAVAYLGCYIDFSGFSTSRVLLAQERFLNTTCVTAGTRRRDQTKNKQGFAFMAQIFDRSSNALARASLVLTGLIVIALGVTLDELQRSPWVTRQGQRPDQPVPFSHKHHVQGWGCNASTVM
jgi:hypothetical protein